jgi:hypothetical protein
LPHPLAYAQTVAELKDHLRTDYNCEFKTVVVKDEQNGDDFTSTYFERIVDGKTYTCAVFFENETERPLWSVVRSICNRLKIDPAVFGIQLK